MALLALGGCQIDRLSHTAARHALCPNICRAAELALSAHLIIGSLHAGPPMQC